MPAKNNNDINNVDVFRSIGTASEKWSGGRGDGSGVDGVDG